VRGPKLPYESSLKRPEFCEIYHKINTQHAYAQIVNVGGLGYNSWYQQTKGKK